ncbi:MAG: cupin [Chloroflexi bacterium]|nr:cupin [Chloroflexota bacterium]
MKTGDKIDKPWGWERILDLNERYCVKHLFVRSGHRLSLQYHERKRETMVLVSGGAELSRGASADAMQAVDMAVGEPYVIEPGTVHRLRGTAPDGCLVLEVSSPEVEDLVRLEDDYGR